MAEGWVAPKTDAQVRERFFAKYGDEPYIRDVDRKWRRIGRLIESGARIRDGYLGR